MLESILLSPKMLLFFLSYHRRACTRKQKPCTKKGTLKWPWYSTIEETSWDQNYRNSDSVSRRHKKPLIILWEVNILYIFILTFIVIIYGEVYMARSDQQNFSVSFLNLLLVSSKLEWWSMWTAGNFLSLFFPSEFVITQWIIYVTETCVPRHIRRSLSLKAWCIS